MFSCVCKPCKLFGVTVPTCNEEHTQLQCDWMGVVSLHLVQCCWPALVGWRFSCVCAFDAFLL